MPARKHREGDALADWEARKAQHVEQMELARARVQSLTNHVLLRPIEVAAMLGTTRKTLREMEARGELPPRVSFSPKVFGWRLADMEALIREKMGAAA
ncbi:MAG: AlpA family phage regulatory protein [Pseudomonadota bacterium]|jgi:predicted DNA-binding transcriptional regulator AlpA|uniref:AlpA family phage regulatory protein n=2 Tax=Sphingomonas echinoides TaxID=59803 RepID=A0ABU4PI41_9SPHN|nr:AlpA family phage regulatory protein [Sphingomonas echinoides]MDX5983701.1 AlpA family phage regulatory protein [Sphingomonas echinoides]